MLLYYLEMIGTAVFAATGVLAVKRQGLDVIGGLILGVVAALGGGTVRDVAIDMPVFWIRDFNYVWVAVVAALVAFFFKRPSLRHRPLLYLDAWGAALFAVVATDKVLALQLGAPVAVTMGVLTGIGGGLLRDILAGRPTLLMSREIYATPILLGCVLLVLLRHATPELAYSGLAALAFIGGLRSCALYWSLQMPAWLTRRED
ncbi:trimeric intracellular cation channel family protein [Vineibacter terrae]|uniref:trimeric intracellular cation channel family protein n=1 Tax=Vineibacter terrae TaxID=2586908 RepID=UPI002E3569ED|nr:TRIC cation channel family protein [Vineibacter terrae]HEX2888440.1 TRIC cation channel family protein [Vineibacter terrae]